MTGDQLIKTLTELPAETRQLDVVMEVHEPYQEGALTLQEPLLGMKAGKHSSRPCILLMDSEASRSRLAQSTVKLFKSLIENVEGGRPEPIKLWEADNYALDLGLLNHIGIHSSQEVKDIDTDIRELMAIHGGDKRLNELVD